MTAAVDSHITPAQKALFATRWLASKAGLGSLPDFIIIGAQRCGTSSMYQYLVQHPEILPALRKEVHFFDNDFARGPSWYQGFFPLRKAGREGSCITGEATPYYLYHPLIPQRVAERCPAARLIVQLRNPVDRAWSNYRLSRRRGQEPLEFSEAIAKEDERLAGEEERLLEDPLYYSYNHKRFSYLRPGLYHQQLSRWYSCFPREQILILNSEDFFADPGGSLAETLAFLGLRDLSWKPAEFRAFQSGGEGEEMDPVLRKQLQEHFHEPNRKLFDLLGRDFGWNE